MFLLLVLSAILLALIIPFPTTHAYVYKEYCTCNHFDPSSEYTVYDEYVGTSIQAWGSGSTFDGALIHEERAEGGYYGPPIPLVHEMNCEWEYWHNGMGYQYNVYVNTPVPWIYPYDPLGVGFSYHAQIWEKSLSLTGGQYVGAQCISYFPWPVWPDYMWCDVGTLTQVFYNS